MHSAIIAGMVSVALVTWLPDVAREMRQSMNGIASELHEATGGGPLVIAQDGGN